MNQYYEAEVVSEYVIRGNTAVLKCNIPSFVADFVRVEAWVGSDDSEYTHGGDYGDYAPSSSLSKVSVSLSQSDQRLSVVNALVRLIPKFGRPKSLNYLRPISILSVL